MHELTATLVEVVSVPAAEKRLEDTIDVPRPERNLRDLSEEEAARIRESEAVAAGAVSLDAVLGAGAVGEIRMPVRQAQPVGE